MHVFTDTIIFETNRYVVQVTLCEIQVLTVMNVIMRAFWDIVPCSLIKVDQHFRGAYRLHHQGDE
jgi:hypothetical protein